MWIVATSMPQRKARLLCVCLYVCVSVCVCARVCAHARVYVHACMCVHVHTCVRALCVRLCACMCARACVRDNVCACVCLCMCVWRARRTNENLVQKKKMLTHFLTGIHSKTVSEHPRTRVAVCFLFGKAKPRVQEADRVGLGGDAASRAGPGTWV